MGCVESIEIPGEDPNKCNAPPPTESMMAESIKLSSKISEVAEEEEEEEEVEEGKLLLDFISC